LGQAPVPGVDLGLDLGKLLEQVGGALGPHSRLVVHTAGAERPRPQRASLAVGDDGGLLGVHLLLARGFYPDPPGRSMINTGSSRHRRLSHNS